LSPKTLEELEFELKRSLIRSFPKEDLALYKDLLRSQGRLMGILEGALFSAAVSIVLMVLAKGGI